MYARLGFSVAAHFVPDVLLVDEVLAVGDAEFQPEQVIRRYHAETPPGRHAPERRAADRPPG